MTKTMKKPTVRVKKVGHYMFEGSHLLLISS